MMVREAMAWVIILPWLDHFIIHCLLKNDILFLLPNTQPSHFTSVTTTQGTFPQDWQGHSYCTARSDVGERHMALPHSMRTSERWNQCCWWWWPVWLGRGLPCWWNLAFPYSSCCQSYVGNISESVQNHPQADSMLPQKYCGKLCE